MRPSEETYNTFRQAVLAERRARFTQEHAALEAALSVRAEPSWTLHELPGVFADQKGEARAEISVHHRRQILEAMERVADCVAARRKAFNAMRAEAGAEIDAIWTGAEFVENQRGREDVWVDPSLQEGPPEKERQVS